MNDLINELYQEIILDHGREPRNFGECDPHNKSCLLYTSDAADE